MLSVQFSRVCGIDLHPANLHDSDTVARSIQYVRYSLEGIRAFLLVLHKFHIESSERRSSQSFFHDYA